jgi:predicted esterase
MTSLNKINDLCAGAAFPSSLVTNGSFWTEGDNTTPLYPHRWFAKTGANRLIIFLHSWSADMSQITSLQELTNIDRCVFASPDFGGSNSASGGLMYSDAALEQIHNCIVAAKAKTQLERVYLVAYSGGTAAALSYMAKYPGMIHRASIWLPIYDLALLHSHTSDNSLKTDMNTKIGSAPVDLDDSRYLARSAKGRLTSIVTETTLFINTGTQDTVTPKVHGELARDAFTGKCTVVYKEWNIGHVFNTTERLEAVKQLTYE